MCPYCRDDVLSSFASKNVLHAYYQSLYGVERDLDGSFDRRKHFLNCLPHKPIRMDKYPLGPSVVDGEQQPENDIGSECDCSDDMQEEQIRSVPLWLRNSVIDSRTMVNVEQEESEYESDEEE